MLNLKSLMREHPIETKSVIFPVVFVSRVIVGQRAEMERRPASRDCQGYHSDSTCKWSHGQIMDNSLDEQIYELTMKILKIWSRPVITQWIEVYSILVDWLGYDGKVKEEAMELISKMSDVS